ncbi:hypothetical protein GBO31_00400 [Aquimarina litoralis]|nr:hypothetical protein [Aquimarina litoralis]
MKTLLTKIGLLGILMTFAQCATSQKIDKIAPVELNAPYFQKWVSGIRGGGQGFTLYFPVAKESDVVLHTAYFKGKKVDLNFNQREGFYRGKYTDPESVKPDMIMSGDAKDEYGNKAPKVEEKTPFVLKDDECIIAYTKSGKEGFFKLDKLPEKELEAYPMKPRQ